MDSAARRAGSWLPRIDRGCVDRPAEPVEGAEPRDCPAVHPDPANTLAGYEWHAASQELRDAVLDTPHADDSGGPAWNFDRCLALPPRFRVGFQARLFHLFGYCRRRTSDQGAADVTRFWGRLPRR